MPKKPDPADTDQPIEGATVEGGGPLAELPGYEVDATFVDDLEGETINITRLALPLPNGKTVRTYRPMDMPWERFASLNQTDPLSIIDVFVENPTALEGLSMGQVVTLARKIRRHYEVGQNAGESGA